MCSTKFFKSRDCDHRWLEIDPPCDCGMGFTACPSFHGEKRARAAAAPKRHTATREECPWHGLKGNYDFNYTRMIEKTRYGVAPVEGVICCAIM